MLWGAKGGSLELRREGGATRLLGSFPYQARAALGRGREETFAPRAFRSRIDAGEEIYLLAGHSFDRPLASRGAGTLELRDGETALEIEARIAPEIAETTHGRDALAMLSAGLATGLSPGFRIAEAEGAERVERSGGGVLRTVNAAELFEVSIVTRPAYDGAQVEARRWSPNAAEPPAAGLARALNRWRA